MYPLFCRISWRVTTRQAYRWTVAKRPRWPVIQLSCRITGCLPGHQTGIPKRLPWPGILSDVCCMNCATGNTPDFLRVLLVLTLHVPRKRAGQPDAHRRGQGARIMPGPAQSRRRLAISATPPFCNYTRYIKWPSACSLQFPCVRQAAGCVVILRIVLQQGVPSCASSCPQGAMQRRPRQW